MHKHFYVLVCECVYVYTHTHTHTYISIYIHTHTHTHNTGMDGKLCLWNASGARCTDLCGHQGSITGKKK